MAHISFSQHTIKNLQEFDACIETTPEIVASYRVSGNVDYILRVVVPSDTLSLSAPNSCFFRIWKHRNFSGDKAMAIKSRASVCHFFQKKKIN